MTSLPQDINNDITSTAVPSSLNTLGQSPLLQASDTISTSPFIDLHLMNEVDVSFEGDKLLLKNNNELIMEMSKGKVKIFGELIVEKITNIGNNIDNSIDETISDLKKIVEGYDL